MATVSAKLFDSGVRVDRVIWLPGAVVDFEGVTDSFRDFIEDDFPESSDNELCRALPVLKEFAESDDAPEIWEVCEALHGVSGFLVKAETPVRSDLGGGIFSFSWGHVYYAWLYAKDEASIPAVVMEWAARRVAEDTKMAEIDA